MRGRKRAPSFTCGRIHGNSSHEGGWVMNTNGFIGSGIWRSGNLWLQSMAHLQGSHKRSEFQDEASLQPYHCLFGPSLQICVNRVFYESGLGCWRSLSDCLTFIYIEGNEFQSLEFVALYCLKNNLDLFIIYLMQMNITSLKRLKSILQHCCYDVL